MSHDLAARVRDLALLFTSWNSVTGTEGEARFAAKLSDLVKPQAFTENLVYDVSSAARDCGISLIFKRGRSHRTIVLTGHYDTVPFDDYGAFQHLALSPASLTKALAEHLRQTMPGHLALQDFDSGAFLAGRGLLDMKAGLAAGLAVLEHYAGVTSLILLSVCDEEEKSAGARAAVPLLKSFAQEHKLAIDLVINLDSISDQGDGSNGRVVTYGSIGKQLLAAHVVGKQVHAGYAENGVNAAYVMAELVRAIELSPLLVEQTGAEVTAAPATLYAKDGKSGYNVSTPASAFAYWNTLQHQRSGAEVLEIALDIAREAIRHAEAKTGHRIALKPMSALPTMGHKPDPALSLPDQTAQVLTQATRDTAEPTVYLGFASIPYPAVRLRDAQLRKIISEAVAPFQLGEVNYFAGISDMSFFGQTSGDLALVAANTPIWGTGFTMPESGGFPTINIGPWGRDYHTWLERLHAPYAFDTLPRVLLAVIDAVAKAG
jgi:arginine utilization protein RocB